MIKSKWLLFLLLLPWFAPHPVWAQGNTCSGVNYCTGNLSSAAADLNSVQLYQGQDIATVVATVEGTYSGTLQFEGLGGGTWASISGTPSNSTTTATSTTGVGQWRFPTAGLTAFRVRVSSYSSGTAVITLQSSRGSPALTGSGASGSGVTSVTFTGDGVVLSSTPSSAVTTSGTLTASLANFSAFTLLANNTSGSAAPTVLAFNTLFGSCSGGSNALTYNTTTHAFGCNTITGGVSSFTGDGVLLSNSGSTGAVTATLANLAAFSFVANNTSGSAALTNVTFNTLFGSCSAATSALTFNTTSHVFGCNTLQATLTNSLSLGTDNSAAGTVQLSNGSANAHTTWGSGATTSNTINGFTVVPTTGNLVSCVSASTTCTLTDSGLLASSVLTTLSTLSTTPNGTTCTIGSTCSIGALFDSSGLKTIDSTHTASAVDYFNITNAATANPSTITIAPATGGSTSTNVTVALTSKGTGLDNLNGFTFSANGAVLNSTAAASLVMSSASGQNAIYGAGSGGNGCLGSGKFCVSQSNGIVGTYDNLTTAGLGVTPTLGVSNVTNQTASQTTVNLSASTPAAGFYIVDYYYNEKTACTTVATGGVTMTVSWTDATAARNTTTTILSADTSGVASDFISGSVKIWSATASAISYITTYNATCGTGGPFAYDLHAQVSRSQ